MAKTFWKKIIPIIFIFILSLIFFWKVIFINQIIFPGDMLVGAYYPWLDFKWGTITGVPIKNPYITDIFSQIYLWKELITKSYLNGQWPLWNPYSYSGYPLLANFQSGALNVFNVIFIIFGMISGWNIFLILGIILSQLTMYIYLKVIKISTLSAIIASISFGFSGFSILWMPYANANYALATIPLILYLIEKYFQTQKRKFILLVAPAIFFMISAGHFQIAIYGLIISSLYILFKIKLTKIITPLSLLIFIPIILGIGMSMIQLLPTYELSQLSVRYAEGFINKNNFGLSPLPKLITLYIPDYFGNSSTFNYWGFFNYHETNFYVGVMGIFALIWSIVNYKILDKTKFFLFCSIISLMLGFDTILSKSIYVFQIPGISTSAAGRIASIYSFSTSILIAKFLDTVSHQNLFKKILPGIYLIIVNIVVIFVGYKILPQDQLMISLRNNIFPLIILLSILISISVLSKFKNFKLLILLIVTIDLFRFGWKSTPFVNKSYVFPETPLTELLKKDNSIFRIEREYSPIMPPNTWTHYNLSSSSGYDPLAVSSYVIQYNKILNNNNDLNPQVTRYSELFNYNPIALGEFNVKYLLMQKNYSIDKKTYNYNKIFNQNIWKKQFETDTYTLFENIQYKPRLEVIPSTTINNVIYSPNNISLQVGTSNPNSLLILRDTYYPGWQAKINNKQINIEKYNDTYRQIKIPVGESDINFSYNPSSFNIGLTITILSLAIFTVLIFIL